MDKLILESISGLEVLRFSYNNLQRVCEPHVFGTANGKKQLLCYQTGGESSRGGLPQWRRFDLDGITGMESTGVIFGGARDIPKGAHSIWDTVISYVR